MNDRARLSDGEAFSFPEPVGLIGAGRVGSSIGRVLFERGHRIAGVAAKTATSAEALATKLRAKPVSISALVEDAALIVIAVPDDSLGDVVDSVCASVRPGTWVIHTCGRIGLEALKACGANIAAIHPATPVATSDISFEGVPFGVTCDDGSVPFAEAFVRELGGSAVRVREEERVLYHAALVMASNFMIGLVGDAIDLTSKELVIPLLRATLANLESMGTDAAMTGPVVRGDAGTISAHLKAIEERTPGLRDVYIANSLRLLRRASLSGRLDRSSAERVEAALR